VGSATALKMVELLLQVNANLHLNDSEGRTALVHAIKHDRKDIVQLLLEKEHN
jgi:ankyrin repeat protein